MRSSGEKETFIFEAWLECAERSVRNMDLASALDTIAWLAHDAFGAHFWFVESLGRRKSYIGGEVRERPCSHGLAQFRLNEGIGMVVESWGDLCEQERELLKHSLGGIAGGGVEGK